MNRTIAIIGVDGTGKSTLINNLLNKLGNKIVTKYMGSVRFEDKRIAELETKGSLSYIEAIKLHLLTYKCFWERYRTAIRKDNIVLFDRYVHERYINAKGKYKILNTILYRLLFPKPSHVIYIYCSVETSLSRKNDILDPVAFKNMKTRFDKFFLNKKNYCINSDTHNIEEITEIVCNYIYNLYEL